MSPIDKLDPRKPRHSGKVFLVRTTTSIYVLGLYGSGAARIAARTNRTNGNLGDVIVNFCPEHRECEPVIKVGEPMCLAKPGTGQELGRHTNPVTEIILVEGASVADGESFSVTLGTTHADLVSDILAMTRG